MSDLMTFPETWGEFEKSYGFDDSEEIYTNGSRLIPSFRVKQWLDHIAQDKTKQQATVSSDCISRQKAIDAIHEDADWLAAQGNDWQVERMERDKSILMSLPSAEPEIIHCKNCKHRDSNDCPMYYEEWIEIDEGDGYFDTDNIIHDWTTDEGFCYCAELRGKEK